MTPRPPRHTPVSVWLRVAVCALALGACKEAETQTHIVLDVRVASALAKQVTRIAVHPQTRAGKDLSDDAGKFSGAYQSGKAPRFVLHPSSDRSNVRIRVVALHDSDEIASALLTSRYSASRGLFLKIQFGCAGVFDLGEQPASDEPADAIDTCDYAPATMPEAGSSGAGSSGAPAAGSSGANATGQVGASGAGGAGRAASDSGSGGKSEGGAGAHASNTGEAGATSASVSGSAGGGSGGSGGSDGAAAGGSGGSGGGGAGGKGGNGGSGGGGTGGGGTGGGNAGRGGSGSCYTWRTLALPGAIEDLMPEAFRAGTELRDNSSEAVGQFVCRAGPSRIPSERVGKASKYGCYIPGPGDTADSIEMGQSAEILISRNTQPCLVWRALDPLREPLSERFASDPDYARVCRVTHDGLGDGVPTHGERVGQVRFEDGKWVCRFEFYYYVEHKTFANQGTEKTEYLDLGP